MRIFEFENYKLFLTAMLKTLPKKGHGQLSKLAEKLQVHSAYLSQVLRANRNLSLEQAAVVADHFGFSELETEYFLTMVELERAGSVRLRAILTKRMNQFREQSNVLQKRLPPGKELSEAAKGEFYSHWYYCAIRLMTALPGYQSPEALSQHFDLPISTIKPILEFLVSVGLCLETNGVYTVGSARTHAPAGSIHAVRHHVNWRLKAVERFQRMTTRELAYTSPMTLSKKDAGRIRDILLEAISNAAKIVDVSPVEELFFLSIDWLKVER